MRTSTSGNKPDDRPQAHGGVITPGKKKPRKARPRPETNMSLSEVRQWRNMVYSDMWWQSQMPVKEWALNKALGFRSTHTVTNAIHARTPCLDRVVLFVGATIPDIERRALCFPIQPKFPYYLRAGIPLFLRLDPPVVAPLIGKLSPESAWSLWARCSSCGDNKFLPSSGQVACYHCCPPLHDAAPPKRSLIHEALKKFY